MVNLLIPRYMRLTQQEKDLFIRLFFKDNNNIPKQLQTNDLNYEQLKTHKKCCFRSSKNRKT